MPVSWHQLKLHQLKLRRRGSGQHGAHLEFLSWWSLSWCRARVVPLCLAMALQRVGVALLPLQLRRAPDTEARRLARVHTKKPSLRVDSTSRVACEIGTHTSYRFQIYFLTIYLRDRNIFAKYTS